MANLQLLTFWGSNWGDFVSLVGGIIGASGLVFSIMAWRSASRAREASTQARDALIRVLTIGDLQRLIGQIEMLKNFHRNQQWTVALSHYQPLRAGLHDLTAASPTLPHAEHESLSEAIMQISVIEKSVEDAVRTDAQPRGINNFNSKLGEIQALLEAMSSGMQRGKSS